MQYQFIIENSHEYDVAEMFECFDLGRSGYYAWKGRGLSRRAKEDTAHKSRISELYRQAKRRYGHRPIYHHLFEEGIECGRDRTLRLMKELGIEGIQKESFKPLGSDSNHGFGYSPNLLEQLGQPERCDQGWVSDTTYLRSEEGWFYVATVMDLCSRRIIGWSVSKQNDSSLVWETLRGAILTRGGKLPSGLMHHSDRGSIHAGGPYGRMLGAFKIEQSTSARGNCYDNATMESFYGRYKTFSVRGYVFAGDGQARSNAFDYIEVFYNCFRKHPSLGYQSPATFEVKIYPPMGG